MISSIASAFHQAAEAGEGEPYAAWRRAWERLQGDWQSGLRPGPRDLPGYLADVPKCDRTLAALDLVAAHLRLGWEAGCGSTLEEYQQALPEDGLGAAVCPGDLIEDELTARSTPPHGDQPLLANYDARFPQRPDILRRLRARCLGGDRYVKLRVLGAGLLGVVHLAYDRTDGQLVAIKDVSTTGGNGDAALLVREAKITAELDHAGIVRVHDVGQTSDTAFMAMDYVAGRTLAEHIRDYHSERSIRSSRDNACRLERLLVSLLEMADAVAHAHERSVVHRDLKPANAIVREEGRITIIDWGLAQRLPPDADAASQWRAIAGTPQYMAPEQLHGSASPASDVFSLGAILFEILAGVPLYEWPAQVQPTGWEETVRQGPSPSRVNSIQAPPQLKKIVCRALAAMPAARHETAGQLANDLRDYLAQRPAGGGWLFRLFRPR